MKIDVVLPGPELARQQEIFKELYQSVEKTTGVPAFLVDADYELKCISAYTPSSDVVDVSRKLDAISYIPAECWRKIDGQNPNKDYFQAIVVLPNHGNIINVVLGGNDQQGDYSVVTLPFNFSNPQEQPLNLTYIDQCASQSARENLIEDAKLKIVGEDAHVLNNLLRGFEATDKLKYLFARTKSQVDER